MSYQAQIGNQFHVLIGTKIKDHMEVIWQVYCAGGIYQ